MEKNNFIVAQLGARMHYAVPRIFYEEGMLERFCTDICASKGWPSLLRTLPTSVQPSGLRRLLSRVPGNIPSKIIKDWPVLGLQYANKRRGKRSEDQIAAIDIGFGKQFCQAVLKDGFSKATATYTFNSAGLEIINAAKREGLKTVMEQTIAPRAIEIEILKDAAKRYPKWGEQIEVGPNVVEFIKREEEEWERADLIICGSGFVRDGIAERGGPSEKCRVVPYGVDSKFLIDKKDRQPGPLRVLTVGIVGLRKGTPVIWEAAEKLIGEAEFRMVGPIHIPTSIASKKPPNITLTGPVPRSEIIEHYCWADVFLLPSLCEGSATVTYEAMLASLPVICTHNSGSLVIDDINGFTVPILSPEGVVHALQKFLSNPKLLSFNETARAKCKDLSLQAYHHRLMDAVALF